MDWSTAIPFIQYGGNSAMSMISTQMQNEASAEEAHKSRSFNSNEAQKQRNWEEGMSNTAFQRKKADLLAAGINPILGMSENGANAPGGASASSSAMGTMNKIDPLEGIQRIQELNALQENNKKTKAETEAIKEQAGINKENKEIAEKENKYWTAKQLADYGIKAADTLGNIINPFKKTQAAKELGKEKLKWNKGKKITKD